MGLVNESEDGDVNSTATPAEKYANESKTPGDESTEHVMHYSVLRWHANHLQYI